jgi:hypothetical protein
MTVFFLESRPQLRAARMGGLFFCFIHGIFNT